MAAPNFSHLLNKPADAIKKKKPLPAGTYHGIIMGHRFDESREKKTPFVEFEIRLQAAGDDISQDDLAAALEGRQLQQETRRQSFYLTDDAMWRLKEFMESCNIASSGRNLNEMLPETTAKPVLVNLTMTPGRTVDPKTGMPEFYNSIASIVGAS